MFHLKPTRNLSTHYKTVLYSAIRNVAVWFVAFVIDAWNLCTQVVEVTKPMGNRELSGKTKCTT